MKNIGTRVLVMVLCIFSFSCKGNIFAGFESYQEPSAEALTDTDSILKLVEEDERFYDFLDENPEEAEKVIKTLEADVEKIEKKLLALENDADADAVTDAEVDTLLALASIEYSTSKSTQPLEKMTAVVQEHVEPNEDSGYDSLEELVEAFFAPDAEKTDEDKITDIEQQIQALSKSAEYYKLYEAANTDEEGEFTPVDDATNTKGDVAAMAMLAGLVDYLVDTMDEDAIPDDIKNDNELTDEEKKQKTLAKAVAEKTSIPYTPPEDMEEASAHEEIEQILEDMGLSDLVKSGLDLESIVSKLGGT